MLKLKKHRKNLQQFRILVPSEDGGAGQRETGVCFGPEADGLGSTEIPWLPPVISLPQKSYFFLLIVEYVLSSFKTCKDWSLMCFPRRGIAYLFAYLLPIVAPMQ